jgi:hypothetical protein
MGHNTDFFTHHALNMLHVLITVQYTELIAFAESHVHDINQHACDRFAQMDVPTPR